MRRPETQSGLLNPVRDLVECHAGPALEHRAQIGKPATLAGIHGRHNPAQPGQVLERTRLPRLRGFANAPGGAPLLSLPRYRRARFRCNPLLVGLGNRHKGSRTLRPHLERTRELLFEAAQDCNTVAFADPSEHRNHRAPLVSAITRSTASRPRERRSSRAAGELRPGGQLARMSRGQLLETGLFVARLLENALQRSAIDAIALFQAR